MRHSLPVGPVVFVLLTIAGACAEDKVSLPDPTPEPVRMADIGPAGGGAEMTMAADPNDITPSSSTVSTTVLPSTVVTTTAAPSADIPTTMAPPSITRWTAATTIPAPETTSASATPDTPFVVAVATVEMLEVFNEPSDDEAQWLLPHPGPGDGPRTLLVLESEQDWLRVSIPVRPNGTLGWVRIGDVSTTTYRARIIVDLYRGRLEAWEDGALVAEGEIASGAAETPTPPGGFFVTEIQEYTDPVTGDTTWLIGTSAYSESLDPTVEGDPAVAILTVGDDADLSQAISLGCVRIHPDVMERLVLLPLGTPVQILG